VLFAVEFVGMWRKQTPRDLGQFSETDPDDALADFDETAPYRY
jgi:hypothetical protein